MIGIFEKIGKQRLQVLIVELMDGNHEVTFLACEYFGKSILLCENIDERDFKPSIPVIISVQGENVIDLNFGPEGLEAGFSKWLPQQDRGSYYYQSSRLPAGGVVGSFVSRNKLHDLLSLFEPSISCLIGVSIGKVHCHDFLSSVVTKEQASDRYLSVLSSMILLEKGVLGLDNEFSGAQLKVSGKVVADHSALAYAAVSAHLQDKAVLGDPNYDDSFGLNKQGIVNKRLLLFGLFTLFVLLVANYFFFSYLREEKIILESENASVLMVEDQLSEMKRKRELRYALFGSDAFLSSERISYGISYALSHIPVGISLTRMEVHPLSSSIQPEKEIAVDHAMVRIKGRSDEGDEIREWMGVIASLNISAHLELLQVVPLRDGGYEFEFEMQLR